MKDLLIIMLATWALSAVSIVKDSYKESDIMKAKQATSSSRLMHEAMKKPENQVPRLETPDVVTSRKNREMFYEAISRKDGIHVRF